MEKWYYYHQKGMYTTLINAKELHELLGQKDLVIVDCRFSLADTGSGRRAYAREHIPGAFYAHLDEDLSGPVIAGETGRHPLPSIEQTARLFSGWGVGPETQVVAYDDMSGAIAARLWWMLRWLGHEGAAVLDGGWDAWKEQGRPVDTAAPAKVSGHSFQARPRPELLAEVRQVENTLNDPNYRLVDSRTPERYRGESEPIDPVAGHIPGAINIPHPGNVDAAGNWLSRGALEQRFRAVIGDVEADHTIFYCGSGVTACRNILAYAHAGLGEAKLYAGSWSEWIQSNERMKE